MGRIKKINLDYFPMDVDMFQDIKIRKLIKYQQGDAVTVYTLLLCLIYKNGYFMLWDEELPFIVSEQTGFKEAHINEVIKCCLSLGLFSKEMFKEYRVLTSKGIQERYRKIRQLCRLSDDIPMYKLIDEDMRTPILDAPPNNPMPQPHRELTAADIDKEEQWYNQQLGDQLFIETAAMRYHVSIDDIKRGLQNFHLENKAKGKKHSDVTDYRYHAFDWLRYWVQDNTKKNNDNDKNQQRQQSQRRGSEITATKAEDYTTTF